MRGLKAFVALVLLFVTIRFVTVYYGSWQFDDFLKQQTKRIHSTTQFKQSLLSRATEYSLPIRESDITLTNVGSVLRVNVDYMATVDLIVYQPKLQFHSSSAGIVHE
jgi:hypothetical protein